MTPLKGLYNLKKLFLVDTEVSAIEFLADLPSLSEVYLSNSRKFTDLNNHSSIKKLLDKDLAIYLNGNQISNLDFLPEPTITISIATFMPQEGEKEKDFDENTLFIGKPVRDAAKMVIRDINSGKNTFFYFWT